MTIYWSRSILLGKLIFILGCLGIFCRQPLAQDASQLPYFQEASLIGQWLLQSTSHQSILSATPLIEQFPTSTDSSLGLSLPRKNQLSTSYSQSILSHEVQDAYRYFGVEESSIPYAINLLRVNFNQAITSRTDLGVELLSASDIGMEGVSLHWSYSFLRWRNMWMCLRPYYFRSWREDNFRTQGYGVSLSYSFHWNNLGLDLYLGTKYLQGKVNFSNDHVGASLPTVIYSSKTRDFENYIGLQKNISGFLATGFQFNSVASEKTYLLKLSWAFPMSWQNVFTHRLSTFY